MFCVVAVVVSLCAAGCGLLVIAAFSGFVSYLCWVVWLLNCLVGLFVMVPLFAH